MLVWWCLPTLRNPISLKDIRGLPQSKVRNRSPEGFAGRMRALVRATPRSFVRTPYLTVGTLVCCSLARALAMASTSASAFDLPWPRAIVAPGDALSTWQ